MNCLFFIIFFGKWFFLLNLSFKVLTVVDDWESSKLHLCNKLAPFKTRLCTLKALNYWFSVVSKQVGLKTFKWATIHHHSSKGSKTVTCQSWKCEKISPYPLRNTTTVTSLVQRLTLLFWQCSRFFLCFKCIAGYKRHMYISEYHSLSCFSKPKLASTILLTLSA